MRYRSINQVLFAGVLLTLGVVLLLINIGVISLEIKEIFVVSYPFLILIYGIISLINSIRNKNGLFWGLFIVLFSSLLVLDRFDVITFKLLDVWKLWPFIIIYIGFSLLFKKDSLKFHFEHDLPADAFKEEIKKNHCIEVKKNDCIEVKKQQGPRKMKKGFSIGDVSLKKSNWSLEPMELYNTIGDYFIDFSKAYIPERETKVVLHGWIGDVKMIIPEDIPVMVQARIKVGDIRVFDNQSEAINRSLFYKSNGYDETTRKLNILIELKIGSIRIDKV